MIPRSEHAFHSCRALCAGAGVLPVAPCSPIRRPAGFPRRFPGGGFQSREKTSTEYHRLKARVVEGAGRPARTERQGPDSPIGLSSSVIIRHRPSSGCRSADPPPPARPPPRHAEIPPTGPSANPLKQRGNRQIREKNFRPFSSFRGFFLGFQGVGCPLPGRQRSGGSRSLSGSIYL